MTTPDFRAMSATSFIDYLVPLLRGAPPLYPLPAFDPQAVADEVKRRLEVERGYQGKACPVCNGVGTKHVCSWVCVEIKCAYCNGTGKMPPDAMLAPLDFSRPLVWCDGGAAEYGGSLDCHDGLDHFVRAPGNAWTHVNSTGHDRSGRQVVRQKEER